MTVSCQRLLGFMFSPTSYVSLKHGCHCWILVSHFGAPHSNLRKLDTNPNILLAAAGWNDTVFWTIQNWDEFNLCVYVYSVCLMANKVISVFSQRARSCLSVVLPQWKDLRHEVQSLPSTLIKPVTGCLMQGCLVQSRPDRQAQAVAGGFKPSLYIIIMIRVLIKIHISNFWFILIINV